MQKQKDGVSQTLSVKHSTINTESDFKNLILSVNKEHSL